MLKIIIADDENIVRLGMQTLIDWESNGFEIAGLFVNGLEALEYCEKEPVDILITDIKMPVMDGTELIHAIRAKYPDISILVLSNYDDFRLVSNSYKEGICEYLLKQFIEPASLLEALNSIRARIEKQQFVVQVSDKNDNLKTRQQRLKALLLDKGAAVPAGEELDAIGPERGAFFCLTLKLLGAQTQQPPDYEKISPILSNLCLTMRETSKKYADCESLALQQNIIALLVRFPADSTCTQCRQKIEQLAQDVSGTVISIFNFNVAVGCSGPHGEAGELAEACGEALAALESFFYEPSRRLYFFEDLRWPKAAPIDEAQLHLEIISLLRMRDYKKLLAHIDRFFESVHAERSVEPERFKQILIKIVYEIDLVFLETCGIHEKELLDHSDKNVLRAILDSTDIAELKRFFHAIVAHMTEPVAERNKDVPIVEEAERYIRENYRSHIGLAEVSERLGINKYYLCRLFKDRTGENISLFIAKIRIEESMNLIRTTKFSSEEIAERVGFPGANYFVRTFKKITGQTVTEFRNLAISQRSSREPADKPRL